jgi:AGCS family alanine or glycine:cation symporter
MFTALGAAITLDAVIKFSDAMILALVFPNIIGLFFLYPVAKKELSNYLRLIKAKKKI